MFPTVSKTSSILEETYTTLSPLLFPPPSTFPYPLIESFAAAHDPLTEAYGQKLFTASMALREAGVQVERATAARNMADLPGEQPTTSDSNVGPPHKELSLAEVKKSRLRAKLQSQSAPQSSPSAPCSPEAVLRAAQERREGFDAEMARKESLALEEFKRGLREVVLFAPVI